MKTILNKKILLSFIVFAYFSCLPEISIAKDTSVYAQLNLVQMKCLKSTERGKDEVYFEIRTIDKQSKHPVVRIPPVYPITVPFSNGSTIENAKLLEQKLAPGQSITLIISILESDLSDFNPDDLIGIAEVTLRNDNGDIKSEWDIPRTRYSSHTKITKLNNRSEYSMTGDGGSYKLIFEVTPLNKTK